MVSTVLDGHTVLLLTLILAVRFDLILCMTPYFHDDHGVLNCYETEDTRKWLACGETFDDENLQGSTAMTLIEVKVPLYYALLAQLLSFGFVK